MQLSQLWAPRYGPIFGSPEGDQGSEGVIGNNEVKHNKRFKQSFKWLQETIADIRTQLGSKDRRILVLTHHAPTLSESSRAAYNDRYMTDIFCRNQSDHRINGLGKGDAWMFGYTHMANDFRTRHRRVASILKEAEASLETRLTLCSSRSQTREIPGSHKNSGARTRPNLV